MTPITRITGGRLQDRHVLSEATILRFQLADFLNLLAAHSVARAALKALPGVDASRPGKKVLVRTDGAGHTHDLLDWLHARGVQYSVGFTLPDVMPELYALVPESCWQAALDADGDIREGAALVEITDLLAGKGLLQGYPPGIRVIDRRERPHPGAQLRFDDVDGYRLTAFATNTARGQLQGLELAAAPGSKTGSGSPRTPAWPTSRYNGSTRTGSGKLKEPLRRATGRPGSGLSATSSRLL